MINKIYYLENLESIFQKRDKVVIGISRKRFLRNLAQSVCGDEPEEWYEAVHLQFFNEDCV